MKKFTVSIFLLVVLVFSLTGQNVNITSAFDSSKIYIGDQIKFTISVDKPSDLKLTIPVLKDTLAKSIEIISGPKIDSTSTNGRTNIIQKYIVTSFDSGTYKVKPVYVEAKSSTGLKRFYSGYSALEVMRVKIAPADSTAKIFDIIEPYRAPITLGEVLPWILIATLIGVVIWGAVRYFRNRKMSIKGEVPYIPPDPAHVIAFRELETLKTEELWQKGETKKYYTGLTEILRRYLENRFSVYSLELTTGETLDALVKTGFKKNAAYNQLKSVLNSADLVKFAKHKPGPEENESYFQAAWDFVLSTMEREVQETVEVNGKEESV